MADLTLKKIGDLLDKKLDQKLEPVNQKLDSLTIDMMNVQKKTDALKDIQSYLVETVEKVEDHEDRIQRLETAA